MDHVLGVKIVANLELDRRDVVDHCAAPRQQDGWPAGQSISVVNDRSLSKPVDDGLSARPDKANRVTADRREVSIVIPVIVGRVYLLKVGQLIKIGPVRKAVDFK